MIKLVYCLRKRADLSIEAFREHWLGEHAALMKRLQSTLGALKYVQSHSLDTPINDELPKSRGMPPRYEGITEVWYESLEKMQQSFRSAEFQKSRALLIEDEAKFIDFSNSRSFLTEEHVIF